jgi:hypothetical protein
MLAEKVNNFSNRPDVIRNHRFHRWRHTERPMHAAESAAVVLPMTVELRSNRINLHWHDLRHEYASRLVEHGVPLSQVRDLLGHASITTTERYDNQTANALMAAARRLDTGEAFTIPSHPTAHTADTVETRGGETDENLLQDEDLGDGVDDGTRTRNLRRHRPAL